VGIDISPPTGGSRAGIKVSVAPNSPELNFDLNRSEEVTPYLGNRASYLCKPTKITEANFQETLADYLFYDFL
jgi:hypothetical protein